MGKEKKKHRKKSSKHKKNKPSKSKTPLSSEDSSNSEEEWVEQAPNSTFSAPHPLNKNQDQNLDNAAKQEDWMMNSALFACISRDDIRQSKEKNKDAKHEDDKYMLDKLGQTDRELNPYWKGGGSGLPSKLSTGPESLRQATVTVGDQGSAWLRKALQRAKEQAADQGRLLEAVVAERWGSLEKLESMISAAEERDRIKARNINRSEDKGRHSSSSSSWQEREKYDERIPKPGCNNGNNQRDKSSRSDKYSGNCRSSKNQMAKPVDSDDGCNKSQSRSRKEKSQVFYKPASTDDSSDYDKTKTTSKKKGSRRKYSESSNDSSSSRSSSNEDKHRSPKKNFNNRNSNRTFCKPFNSSSEDNKRKHYDKYKKQGGQRRESKNSFIRPFHDSEDDSSVPRNEKRQLVNFKSSYSSSRSGWRKKPENEIKEVKPKSEQIEPEEPSAPSKVIETAPVEKQPMVLTDKEMNELGAKLVKAEILGNQALVDELKEQMERAREAKASGPQAKVEAEVVVLTHTDSKGFTRPVSLGGLVEPTGGRRKANKVETHSDGKRMRYFADDDKYSLQEMFHREKLSTVEDSNEVFAKLASKGVGRDDSARDMDDVFEETARVEKSDGRRQARERQQAIEHSKRTNRSLDNCQWCLESKQMLKHLIIAIGNQCYLCVPPYQSLTEWHCLIVPNHHCPCATQLDEDVWAEMQKFRSSLVKMFLSQDEDVVFFECARYLNKFPHMVLNCVPMPKETGDLAPIYFKKAIQECEMEWSNNKKLVELKGRDVRHAVPRGLPYFAVDFGYDSGFAHVIEDEKLFPQNFAQEIIGGMLDLDHTIWRKQRKQTFEEQSKKVIQLAKLWAPFDCTKNE